MPGRHAKVGVMAQQNLRQLEIFCLLMQTHSVSETARRLNISQPAVSKALKSLENHIDMTLFRRVGGRILPGPDAVQFHADAERLLAQAEMLHNRVEGLRHAREGILTIAAIPTLAASIVGLSLGQFIRSRPRMRAELLSEISGKVVQSVSSHRVELGFIHGPPTTHSVDFEQIGESEIVCLMNRSHALAERKTLGPKDLSQQPLIFLDALSPPSILVREAFARARVRPRDVVETNMSAAAKAIAANGAGIALIDPLVMAVDKAPEVVMRQFRPRIPLRIFCIRSPYQPLSNLAKVFIQDFRQTVLEAAAASPFIVLSGEERRSVIRND
jgi:DNA-binding transcriptional LysR family regulator